MPRNRYDEPLHPKVEEWGPTRTKNSEANDVDVNTIVKRYQRTGVVTSWSGRMPMYGDFSHSVTLKDSLDLVHAVNDDFRRLAPEVRYAAKNDPVEFLRMLSTEDGSAALVAAGLELDPRPGDSDYVSVGAAAAAPQNEAPAEPSPSGEATTSSPTEGA